MTSTFFDAGDMERLDRERTLTEQAPRQIIVDDRSPDEDLSILDINEEPDFNIMLERVIIGIEREVVMSSIFRSPKKPKLPPVPEPIEVVETVQEDEQEVRRRKRKKLTTSGRASTILSGIASSLKKRLGE